MRLDVLYNNAGVFPAADGGTTETSVQTWDRVMDVNLKGVWLGCKHGIPAMLESGGGAIVNVASFVAFMGAATPQIAYTSSKGGVLAMTREIAVEYARRGNPRERAVPRPDRHAAAGRAHGGSRNGPGAGSPTSPWAVRVGPRSWPGRHCSSRPTTRPYMTGSALVVDGGITAAYVTPE